MTEHPAEELRVASMAGQFERLHTAVQDAVDAVPWPVRVLLRCIGPYGFNPWRALQRPDHQNRQYDDHQRQE